jgi:2',3'-cyclic-nucleotide 2'-phosphodiesterase (5'-nucleotidase family)
MRGGLARMFNIIQGIRNTSPNCLLVNCGDTIQGSAEALYTEGSALINVLREFNIDAFAPGNWDFLYGTRRFRELFAEPNPIAPWNALAANLYYNGDPYTAAIGQRVLPPYKIKYINGLKVGILGFTAERGPMVVYADVIKGFGFTRGDAEVAEFVPYLRQVEMVDVLIMISELGLANNIRLAEANPGIDVILSSDMHETTWEPVITNTGTIVVEEGTDGTLVGELTIAVEGGRVVIQRWKQHVVDSRFREHPNIATRIAQVRSSFVSGPDFRTHVNPISGAILKIPIDTVIGEAAIPLYRANFSHEPLPGVVEGSSHDFLTDAFRFMGQADVGSIRGFRYGTHIAPGPIRLEDIYHFIPIGPFIARGEVTGEQLKILIENNADGSLNPDVHQWRGGWLYGWSGLRYDLDPYATIGNRAQNIMIQRWGTGAWEPLNPTAIYTHASYNFAREPLLINKIPANNIQVIRGPDGNPIDATEVVAEYLKTHIANPELNRIRILRPLPPPRYRNPEVQPLWGCAP